MPNFQATSNKAQKKKIHHDNSSGKSKSREKQKEVSDVSDQSEAEIDSSNNSDSKLDDPYPNPFNHPLSGQHIPNQIVHLINPGPQETELLLFAFGHIKTGPNNSL
ncbi:hypothetical protein PPACK8108_LOCUS8663 [Phakopsora pachyrhizi]|uniref:Uncharacterized protein n=1 Tax=Phakopsora pachyrhizi TaxID=170000 RepID=A0AAV0AXR6_PHAPC|nr:hypothetical protein PPACK8108_LOCUS8663 [Phakopsora pachyrhizi]